MAIIQGTAQGVDDMLRGTAADDRIASLSGDDNIIAGRGNDTVIGGTGSDVLSGGLGSDTFVWSAGHLTDDAIDYVRDFSLLQGDTLKFLDSGEGQIFQVLSVELMKLEETVFNGFDLNNNVERGTDIVFTVQNAVTGATQEIALLDAWSNSKNDAWVDYLATLGLQFG
jgi:hypothetical protein